MSYPSDNSWSDIRSWLRTPDAAYFVDEAVLGGLPVWEAEELLIEHNIDPSPENMRRLGREVDAALTAGEA